MSIPPNPPDSQQHPSEPSPDRLFALTEDIKSRLADYAPTLAEGQNAELWIEPWPSAVQLLVDQLLGRERHDLLMQCEHLNAAHPEPMWWIASSQSGRLRCTDCSNADRARMYFFGPSLPNQPTPTCDLCRHENDDVVRGIAIAGLIIACLQICRPCLERANA